MAAIDAGAWVWSGVETTMASRSRSFVSRKCHPNRPATVSEPKWEHFINTSFAPLLVPTIPYVSIYISRADEGGIGQ